MRRALQRDGYLNPILLQALGGLMLIVFSVLWAFSGKESALLVGAALALIGIGSAGGALVTVRNEIVQKAELHKEALREEIDR